MASRPIRVSDLPPELRALVRGTTKMGGQRKAAKGDKLGSVVRLAAKAAGLPEPLPEHRFHPTRKWRFDFAFPDLKVAVEYEGLVFRGAGGRHQRAAGLIEDSIKYAEAACLGWVVLRVTTKTKGRLADWLIRVVKLRQEWGSHGT